MLINVSKGNSDDSMADLDKLDHWFDERFSAVEEVELFVRIPEASKVDYVSEPLAKWRVHSSSWTWNNPQSFIDEKKLMQKKTRKREEIASIHSQTMQEAL